MGQALPELFTRRIALDDVGSHADVSGPGKEDALELEIRDLPESGELSEGRVLERTEACMAFEAARDLHGHDGEGWVGFDLDGTLAEYDGWRGIEHIGAPIHAMLERVKEKLARGEDVRIFTARVAGQEGDQARRYIDAWCREHLGRTLPVTNVKDQQMTELWDDRAVQVEANTGRRVDGLEAWTPYRGKRGGVGWQWNGTGKPRYQEQKPGDDEAPDGKKDMPVVSVEAPGSRQPALFDKMENIGTPGESGPAAEKPPEAANIPSAQANKQVDGSIMPDSSREMFDELDREAAKEASRPWATTRNLRRAERDGRLIPMSGTEEQRAVDQMLGEPEGWAEDPTRGTGRLVSPDQVSKSPALKWRGVSADGKRFVKSRNGVPTAYATYSDSEAALFDSPDEAAQFARRVFGISGKAVDETGGDPPNITTAPANNPVEAEPDVKPLEATTMKRVVKTKSGLDVELVATADEVTFVVDHPQAGRLTGTVDIWDSNKGVAWTSAYTGKQRVGLSISKADYDVAMADKQAAKEAELADIRTGKTPVTVKYHDGEYLSGYEVFGPAADMLVQLGVAKDVNGWGTEVERGLIDRFGTAFTYQQATEYAQPRLDAKAEAKAQAEAKRAAIFDEAKETGKPVLLRSGIEYTDEKEEQETENSMNIVRVYAMPDGTTKTERHGTY